MQNRCWTLRTSRLLCKHWPLLFSAAVVTDGGLTNPNTFPSLRALRQAVPSHIWHRQDCAEQDGDEPLGSRTMEQNICHGFELLPYPHSRICCVVHGNHYHCLATVLSTPVIAASTHFLFQARCYFSPPVSQAFIISPTSPPAILFFPTRSAGELHQTWNILICFL